ncbi:O-antigen ligase family protein [Sphingomonas sp. HF-S3]|uniref:O-antigen ligase family protein n=1 Tax=Sphingomonas rustica TaxID=3103142 RepID=A0ABV0BDG4_9SPHN
MQADTAERDPDAGTRLPHRPPGSTERIDLHLAAGLLATAVLLGGSSGAIPARGTVIELLSVLVLAWTLWRSAGRRWPRTAWIACGLVLAIPVLQLVPIPEALWVQLPGHQTAVAIAGFVGNGQRPSITLDSNATWRALLSLVVPAAMFLSVIRLSGASRVLLLRVLVALALGSVVLGILQIASGSQHLYLFHDAVRGLPSGVFGNRNHQASFLVIAAVASMALAHLAPRSDMVSRISYCGLAALFAAGVFATASRAGMALLALSALLLLVMLFRRHFSWKVMTVLGLVVACVAILILKNEVVRDALSRFEMLADAGRYSIWREAFVTAEAYFPSGSGVGTFVNSYQAIEQLDLVGPAFVNRAHNDFLEMLIESGILGFGIVLALMVVFAVRAWSILTRRDREPDNTLGRSALLAILVLILHSLGDYPLRSFAGMAVCAMFAGMLFRPLVASARPDARAGDTPGGAIRSSVPASAIALAALLLAVPVAQAGLSDVAVARGNPELAATLWPGSADAATGRAEALLLKKDYDGAIASASDALRISSQRSRALRTIGLASIAKGNDEIGETAFALAARLGWRDALIQRWVFERSLAKGDMVPAAQAGDAMLRQGDQRAVVLRGFSTMIATPAGRAALVDRLASKPAWTGSFVASLDPATAQEGIAYTQFMTELAADGLLPDGAEVQAFFRNQISAGHVAQVVETWRRLNPDAKGDPTREIIDGSFDRFGSDGAGNGPFGWTVRATPAIILTTDMRSDLSGDPVLTVKSYASRRSTVVAQMLALRPGRYRLDFDVRPGDGAQQSLRVVLECDPSRKRLFRPGELPAGPDWTTVSVRFAIPDSGCAAQALRVVSEVAPSDGAAASFDSFRLSPATD